MTLRRDSVLTKLAAHRQELRAFGVASLLLFGSVARDEARDDSDVDLIVEFDHPIGLFGIARLQAELEAWLERPVDLLTRDALRPESRERVLHEAVRAA